MHSLRTLRGRIYDIFYSLESWERQNDLTSGKLMTLYVLSVVWTIINNKAASYTVAAGLRCHYITLVLHCIFRSKWNKTFLEFL